MDYKHLAAQLGNPTGEDGIRTAYEMHIGNGDMSRHTIDTLQCAANDRVLEIGPGNAGHAAYVLNKAEGIIYQGLDISETMVKEAAKLNDTLVKNGQASFTLGNGLDIPFTDNYFNRIFTVNTIYFWKDTRHVLNEIYRTLVTGGTLCLAYRSSRFMEKLPFTQFGFELYDEARGTYLLQEAGFNVLNTIYQQEAAMSIMNTMIDKDYIIQIAQKI